MLYNVLFIHKNIFVYSKAWNSKRVNLKVGKTWITRDRMRRAELAGSEDKLLKNFKIQTDKGKLRIKETCAGGGWSVVERCLRIKPAELS